MIKNELRKLRHNSGSSHAASEFAKVCDAHEEFALVTSQSVANSMVAEYNRKKRAFEAANTKFKKSGSIDMSRISQYLTSDDIFISKSITREGKNHGVVLVIDWSSSMAGNILGVAYQFLILTTFCKRAGIPFTVNIFTSSHNGIDGLGQTMIANESMSMADIREVFYHLCTKYYARVYDRSGLSHAVNVLLLETFSVNGTPLLQSAYATYIDAFIMKREKKLDNVTIMYITDGEGSIWKSANQTVNSVECPFTHRIFDRKGVDRVSFDQRIMSPINRMTRAAGMKVFNMFIGASTPYRSFIRMDDTHPWDFESGKKENGLVVYEDLAFYNKVLWIKEAEFVKGSNGFTEDGDVTAKKMLMTDAKRNKLLNTIGAFIVHPPCSDFSIT